MVIDFLIICYDDRAISITIDTDFLRWNSFIIAKTLDRGSTENLLVFKGDGEGERGVHFRSTREL